MSVERTLLAGVASVLTAVGAVGKLPDGPRTLLALAGLGPAAGGRRHRPGRASTSATSGSA